MQYIITRYEADYGQAIILPKSNLFVITTIMGVQVVLGTEKYLGLPLMVGRDHTAMFSYIKDCVWLKINSIFRLFRHTLLIYFFCQLLLFLINRKW